MKIIFVIILILFFASSVYAAWEYNFDTDKLDYHSGADIPQPFIDDPSANLESIRLKITQILDLLINANIMSAGSGSEIFFDSSTDEFFDSSTDEFFDNE